MYSDESGPTYYVYVGHDWEADKDKFWGWGKVNAKLHNEPRMYLEYKGDSVYSKRRSSGLVPNTDLGRQYGPEAGDALYYSTEAVFEEFQLFLQAVLTYIRGFPLQPIRIVEGPKPIVPFPSTIGPFFTFLEAKDARRIQKGQVDRTALEPGDRYGLIGAGSRLVPLGVMNDGSLPDLAYDGFIYCRLGEVQPGTKLSSLSHTIGNECFYQVSGVVQVQPKSAEGFYVYDEYPQKEYKRQFFIDNPKLNRLTNQAYAEFLRAAGRTLTPILEYNGGFISPVILCNRDLSLDELVVVDVKR